MSPETQSPALRRWQSQAAIAIAAVAAGMLAVGVVLVLKRDPVKEPLPLDPAAGWTEIAWPLPPTPWWPSKAFVCNAATCGAELTLYVRVKVGFCNCADGIADDAELARIADYADLSRLHEPVDEGRPIVLNGLKGRSRPYRMLLPGEARRSAGSVLIGLNSGCDAVVATGVRAEDGRAELAAADAAIAAFLQREPLRRWTRAALGL